MENLQINLTIWDLIIRLIVAMICGGIIGINRGLKNRPAGIRTHMIICMGSALTIILGIYLLQMTKESWAESGAVLGDVSRLGAQVINGIGFIGVGSIIITGKQQVKGLTTAAGLWASACMGLAIGAGFYTAAIVACVFIFLTVVFFSRLEQIMFSNTRYMNIYVEFDHIDSVPTVIGVLNKKGVEIRDVDVSKADDEIIYNRAVFTIKLPKKMLHEEVITDIAENARVRTVEEL